MEEEFLNDRTQEALSEEEVLEKKRGFKNQFGMTTVEVILILVVLVALVLIFKTQITTLVNNVFDTINSTAKQIYK